MRDSTFFLIKMALDRYLPEELEPSVPVKVPRKCFGFKKDYDSCMKSFNEHLCSREFERYVKCIV
jgi:hypothetical protein